VISGSTFCRLYSSLWRELAPTTDLFVRRINLGQYQRDFAEIKLLTAANRRGFINEIAFELFCQSIRTRERWPSRGPLPDEVAAAVSIVQSSALRRDIGREGEVISEPSADELLDISQQHDRLMQVFTISYSGTIVPEPIFPGCGIIDTCIGDLLVASTLFEVKAGDRLFRSVDVRQLVTYATLNYLSHRYEIVRVGLVNPRVGIRIEIDLDELCFEISGKKSVELLTEISLTLASGEVSR
jgi:hypothetical protein